MREGRQRRRLLRRYAVALVAAPLLLAGAACTVVGVVILGLAEAEI
jgi:hypothetical protein